MASLFDPALLETPSRSEREGSGVEGYRVRPLRRDDLQLGFLQVLQTLTDTGRISLPQFHERFDRVKGLGYFTIVVEKEGEQRRIVACGTLMVECKFIHACGLVGHVEDVAVLASEQGKRLGRVVMKTLEGLARRLGCYKTTLASSPHNQPFYERCGYKQTSLEMANYFAPIKRDQTPGI